MTNWPTENFEFLDDLYATDAFSAFRVRRSEDVFRLTKISREYSDSKAFRAAFRKDQSVLSDFRHDNILQFVEWGETEGQLFYVTEFPVGTPISVRLTSSEPLSQDEATDIGWQIASAIQYAHNRGIVHGQLTLDSIQFSEPLRIKIAGFGLYRWLEAADGEASETWIDIAQRDLLALANILDSVNSSVNQVNATSDSRSLATAMDGLIHDLRAPSSDITARDIQGRLGNMLLDVAGDSIDMRDNRKGLGLSRRSIVDELFDAPEEVSPAITKGKQQSATGCFCVLCAALVVITLLFAVSNKTSLFAY